MATYRFPRMLTLLAWEDELRRGPYAADRAWARADPEHPLHLDFSEVEFVDFGALARALLLLDAAVKAGIPAIVSPAGDICSWDWREYGRRADVG